MVNEVDVRGLANQLVEWGLLTDRARDRALRLHQQEPASGGALHAFARVLETHDFLTARQLADVRRVFAKGLRTCRDCRASIPIGSSEFGSEDRCPYCQKEQFPSSTSLSPGSVDALQSLPVDVEEALHRPENRFSKYVLLGEIGKGGFSVIHRAWNTEEKCYVALKMLRSESESEGPSLQAQELIREAQRAAEMRHPYIIPVYEVGCVSGQHYMAMALLEGYTLAELIGSARARRKISPFYAHPVRYLTIIRDIARAVHYAHSLPQPLIHCDLKPSNIFIEISWTPYVLDFGISQQLNPGVGNENRVLKGSPSYMAPEQILPAAGDIDVTTDIYGLGAILYDLLTGRPPFTGELQEVLDKNLLIDPPPPSSILKTWGSISSGEARMLVIPEEVEALCMRCLEKAKEKRYPSALEVADELNRIIEAHPVTRKNRETRHLAVPKPLPKSTSDFFKPLFSSRRARRALLMTVAMLGLAIVGTAVYLDWKKGAVETARRQDLQRQMDTLAAVLELGAARDGYRKYQVDADTLDATDWVQKQLAEVEAIEGMKKSLIAYLSDSPPPIKYFRLRGRRLLNARVIRASLSRIDVVSRGSVHELSWSELQPIQVVTLARLHKGMSPEARLGAALYAIKVDLPRDARSFLQSLKGTSVESRAAGILERLEDKEPVE